MKPTLLILAAGMGSRYGGLKQIDSIGPGGEAIIEYSVYDAIRAGFGKVVFVIRKDIEAAFRAFIGNKLDGRIEVAYAYQELNDIPGGLPLPAGREKPWGTTHAVWVAREVVNSPFAMINADDFYGAPAFQVLADFFAANQDPRRMAMVGYPITRTLSDHGTVSRGECVVDANGLLVSVEERTKIRQEEGVIFYEKEDGSRRELTPDTIVSMNMWGFKPSLFPELTRLLDHFFATRLHEPKSESYIPNSIGQLVQEGVFEVQVLSSNSPWFGVTYREDKPIVEAEVRKLIAMGVYPDYLWA